MNLSPELGPVHFTQRVCANCDTPSAERCTFNRVHLTRERLRNLVLENREALALLAPFDGPVESDVCECESCRVTRSLNPPRQAIPGTPRLTSTPSPSSSACSSECRCSCACSKDAISSPDGSKSERENALDELSEQAERLGLRY